MTQLITFTKTVLDLQKHSVPSGRNSSLLREEKNRLKEMEMNSQSQNVPEPAQNFDLRQEPGLRGFVYDTVLS